MLRSESNVYTEPGSPGRSTLPRRMPIVPRPSLLSSRNGNAKSVKQQPPFRELGDERLP